MIVRGIDNSVRRRLIKVRMESDRSTLRSVFQDSFFHFEEATRASERIYGEIVSKGSTPLILDLGSHQGLSSLWFACRYPAAKLVGLEAIEENAAVAQENLSWTDASIISKAIWPEENEVEFYFSEGVSDTGGPINSAPTYKARQVATMTATQLEHQFGQLSPFILKVDIEGSEQALFSVPQSWLFSFPIIFFEPHDWSGEDVDSFFPFVQQAALHSFRAFIAADMVVLIKRS